LYRRFGYLQSRLLLEKQADLQSLERRLEDFDRANISTSYTRTLDADVLLPRQALLAEIEHAFNAYGICNSSNDFTIIPALTIVASYTSGLGTEIGRGESTF
jgi:RNA polymerase-binding transcription factor DksA